MIDSSRKLLVPVEPPYRLDLTVAVLRRFSTNLVDVVTGDGWYLRAHDIDGDDGALAVRQPSIDTLEIALLHGMRDPVRAIALVRRTLGTDRHAPAFARGAQTIVWLRDLATRMRGVRSPRYATLFEACVNAIVFQQISLMAASAILGRVLAAIGRRITVDEATIVAFPTPQRFLATEPARLRSAGLSAAKIATLERIARAIAAGELRETELEALPTPEAAAALCAIKGIGPWTAAVILLRGLGRLDVFPQNDSGVARGLLALAEGPVDVAQTLAALEPEQGMLYYHLLLARLERSGELGPRAAATFVSGNGS